MRLPLLGLVSLSLVACGGGTPEPPPPNVPTLPPPPAAAPVPPPAATASAAPVSNDKTKCDESRAKRVADDKDMMTSRIAKALLFKGTGKQIRANCKLASDKPFTPLERAGSGWNVTADMRDSLKCSSLPGGVTKDDAYILLASERGGDKPAFTSGPILAPEEHHPDDQKCATYDKAAGLDLFAPQYGDEASAKKVLEWK